MGQKKYAKSPLLYIYQPTIRTPEAPMQHNYRTPKKNEGSAVGEKNTRTEETSDTAPKKKAPTRRPPKRDYFSKPAGENVTEDSAVAGDDKNDKMYDDDTGDGDRKKFKDMTLRERVDYFLNTPKHVPAMRCEIKTEERKYRGRIVDFQEDEVYMRVGRRKSATIIPLDEILEIGLIGF